MKLICVELCNFRQFFGRHVVNFSQHPDRNITLIHAENGVGKTAFLNAILWCLFEKTTANFEHPNELLNNTKKKRGEYSFHVQVDFSHENRTYTCIRSMTQTGERKFKIFEVDQNGASLPLNNPGYFLNTVVPKDMAEYFFFHGEGKGFTNEGGVNVKEAIRNILGFTIAEMAIDDLKKLKREERAELARVDQTSKVGELQIRIAANEQRLDELNKQLQQQEKEELYLSSEKERLDQEYRESNIEVVKEKQKLRDSKLEELKYLKEHLNSAHEKKARMVRSYASDVFSKKIATEGIDFIDERELKGTIPEPFNEQLVKDILDRNQCICGAEIMPGTEAYACIHKLIEKATDPALLNRVRKARGVLTRINKSLTQAKDEFESVRNMIIETTRKISITETVLQEYSSYFSNISTEGIAQKEQQRKEIHRQLGEVHKFIGSLTARINDLQKSVDRDKDEERRLESTNPKILVYKNRIEFIEKLENKLTALLSAAEANSRKLIITKINDFLIQYVRQDYSASMSSDFKIDLQDRDGGRIAKSDGQSLLLNLTFISALISIARDRANAKGEILQPGASAPFVIDAPFGVLDNEYKANVARSIPNSVDQVVFLLSSSHWAGTVESEIRSKVGAEYILCLKVASTETKNISSTIEIQGKSYDTVEYCAEHDMTEILEVGRYD